MCLIALANTSCTDIICNLSNNCFLFNSMVSQTITLDKLELLNLSTAGPDNTGCVAIAITDCAPLSIAVSAALGVSGVSGVLVSTTFFQLF